MGSICWGRWGGTSMRRGRSEKIGEGFEWGRIEEDLSCEECCELHLAPAFACGAPSIEI